MKLWQTMKISLQLIAVLFMIAYDYIVKVDKHVIRLLMKMMMMMIILIIIIYNRIVLCALIVGVVSSGAGTTDFNFGLFSSGEDNILLVMMAMIDDHDDDYGDNDHDDCDDHDVVLKEI